MLFTKPNSITLQQSFNSHDGGSYHVETSPLICRASQILQCVCILPHFAIRTQPGLIPKAGVRITFNLDYQMYTRLFITV